MSQLEIFTPHLVEVLNVKDDSAKDSFEVPDYWQAWDIVDELADKIGLDDYSFMLTKLTNKVDR